MIQTMQLTLTKKPGPTVVKPELAVWGSRALGKPLTFFEVERPKLPGFKNDVWYFTAHDKRKYVLRSAPPGQETRARSGMKIRDSMSKSGVIVPRTVANTDQIPDYSICELMTRVPGTDLETAWPQLSIEDAKGIAEMAAQTVDISILAFGQEDQVKGWGRHYFGDENAALDETWGEFCHEWLLWIEQRGTDNKTVTVEQTATLEKSMLLVKDELDKVNRSIFVWDVAERNVMVDRGQYSGLVDQDSLMAGDRFVVPALARVSLAKIGCTWADEYADQWLQTWEATSKDRDLETIYAALFALQLATKVGETLPDGKKEPALPAGFVEKFLGRASSGQ